MSDKSGKGKLERQSSKLQGADAGYPDPERLERLFNLSLDMLCVADFDGNFRMINAAFEKTLGYSSKVLLARSFMEFVHPDDRATTRDAMQQLSAGEKISYFENRYRCKDGSYRWLAWTASPAVEEGLVYAVARDITEQKRTLEELVMQRDLLNNILSNVPASIFWKDRDSVFLGCNDRFARDAGLQSPEELSGKTDYDMAWTREESDFYRSCDLWVMDNREPMLNIEESQKQADGSTVTLLTSKAPLLDASGQVTGILGIYMDITKRKQAEADLAEREARLKALFDSAADFIFLTNLEGVIIQANRYVYERTGYDPDEVIGKKLGEFFDAESQILLDRNLPGLRKTGHDRADVRVVCKDGRVIDLECTASAIPDENGEFSTFVIIQRDVTESKAAQQALSESERRFCTIFNSTFHMIGLLDPEGILLEANQTALDFGGLMQEDVVGRPLWETAWWNYSDQVQQRLKEAVHQASLGETVSYEEEVLARNNEIRLVEFTLRPVLDGQGRAVLIIPEGRDITESRKIEEEVQRYQRELAHIMRLGTMGEMASGIAHELNQPLTALVSYCGIALDLLNTGPSSQREISEILERASEQAQRAGSIIRHLREFVSKGGKHRKIQDINQIVRDIMDFLKYEVQESMVKIEFYPGCPACKVNVDKIQIDQVLINLLRNSMEAIRQANIAGGRIVLRSRLLQGERVEVTVTDNGPGIESGMTGVIFEPFQTSKDTGMGIGLSLSHSIIEAHNGKLWLDKDYQDGALFGFELPVVM